MLNEQVLKAIPKWREKIGKAQAIRRLVLSGVPPNTAETLMAGRYKSIPRDLLTKVLMEEMAKDGIKLRAS